MSFEKSGCLQLTPEEFCLLTNVVKGHATDLVKASSAVDRTGLSLPELEQVLESGEYRIVED